jgi:predicted dehydrogenase
VNVGIIGAGGVSFFHHEGYKAAGATVLAIADVNKTALEGRQKQWGIPDGYADYHDLLAREDVEAVSVCLPNALHHPATIAAARAGKHVLCEKPISLSLEQAREMIAECDKAGVVLQVGHHLRTNAFAMKAHELIRNGTLGRITYVRLRQAHDWGGNTTVRDSFGKLASSGGGTLLDNGCHMMDLARYLGGDVREVHARTATLGFEIEVEDTSVVSLEFANGALGTVENAWTATGWEEGFWVYGTRGALEYTNRTGVKEMRHVQRYAAGTGWTDPDVTVHRYGGLDPHSVGVIAFLEAIRGERQVVCTGQDGLEAVRLVLASYESARERKPVTMQPLELPV